MVVNENLKKINLEFSENKNSHIFLIETNNNDKALKDIKDVIKNILNSDENTNKQIDDENYIELCIIRPEDGEIKKDSIAYLQDRLKIKPILSPNMFYIICNAETMNEKSSNKLLKTIEEPNDGIIGFLITTNIDLILPTIKSRCEIVNLMYDNNSEINKNNEELDYKFITALETGTLYDFHRFKKSIDLNEIGKTLVNDALKLYNIAVGTNEANNKSIEFLRKNNSYSKLVSKSMYLNSTMNNLIKPMNADMLYEKIFIELRRL